MSYSFFSWLFVCFVLNFIRVKVWFDFLERIWMRWLINVEHKCVRWDFNEIKHYYWFTQLIEKILIMPRFVQQLILRNIFFVIFEKGKKNRKLFNESWNYCVTHQSFLRMYFCNFLKTAQTYCHSYVNLKVCLESVRKRFILYQHVLKPKTPFVSAF